jgi:hypothetical protein
MKIHGNEFIPTPASQRYGPEPARVDGKDFGTVLKETVERPSQPAPEPRLCSVAPCATVTSCHPTIKPDTGLLVERVGELLDTLDVYRQKLADSRYTVRDMYPDIERFSQQSRDLMPVADSLPEDDGLKDVLNQTLMTATLEAIRFYRGDYVTT